MLGFYGAKAFKTNFPDKRQLERGGTDEPGVPDLSSRCQCEIPLLY